MKTLKTFYGDCVGPFGFPMKSGVAKLVERLLKETSREVKESAVCEIDGQKVQGFMRVKLVDAMNTERRGVEIKKDDERTDVSLITTGAVDRMQEIVDPSGADFSAFKLNPVVTWAHDYRIMPVGRSLGWGRQKDTDPSLDGWLAKTRYSTRPSDHQGPWFPDAVWFMVKNGDLRGKSIGFIPTKGHVPTSDEIKKAPHFADASWVYDEWHLLEYCVCGVQANPTALVQSVSKSFEAGFMIDDETLEKLGVGIPEDLKKMTNVLPSISGCRTSDDRLSITREALSSIDWSGLRDVPKNIVDRLRGRV